MLPPEFVLYNDLCVSRDMGQVAVGMTCDFLRFWSNDTDFAALLQYLTMLPGNLRPALVRS